MASQQQQKSTTIPLKILMDKQSNRVVFVEAAKIYVETLFSFLSLPLTNNDLVFHLRPLYLLFFYFIFL
ncbi:DUF674 family protein [Medicago truncatula]|uniref:DUF674 family protein n=1 Tax=Medicago truncatula TaxID=3880 RepID=G7KI82_MEDTR|nr:DUF674 family protein [Medicago truncatula]